MATFSRLVQRLRARASSDAGFSLVEMMVALFVIGVAMGGLAQLTGSMLVRTTQTRQREAAVGLAHEVVEQIRSNAYQYIKLKDGPETYTENGITYPMLKEPGCLECIQHNKVYQRSGYTFRVDTVVFGIDDAADGLATSDADGNLIDYKRVVLSVIGTKAPIMTYKVDTIVHDTPEANAPPVQGLSVEIHDVVTGNVVNNDEFEWEMTISGTGVLGKTIQEGIYNNFSMNAGSYTCTVSNNESTEDWHPSGTTANEDSFPCTVTAGLITTYSRVWEQTQACLVNQDKSGTLWVKVQKEDGTPLAGATVDPAPTGGQAVDPDPLVTDASGEAQFTGILIGPYSVAASAEGYVGQTGLNVCITEAPPSSPDLTVTMNPVPLVPTATVEVEIKSKQSGTNSFKVALEEKDGTRLYEQQQDLVKDQFFTFVLHPEFSRYHIRVYCWKSGTWDRRKEDKDEDFLVETPPYHYGKWDIGC